MILHVYKEIYTDKIQVICKEKLNHDNVNLMDGTGKIVDRVR